MKCEVKNISMMISTFLFVSRGKQWKKRTFEQKTRKNKPRTHHNPWNKNAEKLNQFEANQISDNMGKEWLERGCEFVGATKKVIGTDLQPEMASDEPKKRPFGLLIVFFLSTPGIKWIHLLYYQSGLRDS